MQYVIEQLKALLAIPSPSGFTQAAAEYTAAEFSGLGYAASITLKGCVLADLGGEGQPLVLASHLDTLGGMVAEVKANGRLRLTRVGGLQPHSIEGENCTVFTRFGKQFSGCMQLNSPSVHVNKDYATASRDFDGMEVVLDEDVATKEATLELGVSVGDYVCFDPRTQVTESGYIKSRFLDDKLSVAILLGFAKHLKDSGTVPGRKLYAYITVYEEVGHGCANLPVAPQELLAVDMGCVGPGVSCTERQVSICAKDGSGPYDYGMTTRLVRLAKELGLSYAVDIYPYYASDASAAVSAGHDVRCALIGSGVYASHGYERTHMDGAKNTLELIKAYALAYPEG